MNSKITKAQLAARIAALEGALSDKEAECQKLTVKATQATDTKRLALQNYARSLIVAKPIEQRKAYFAKHGESSYASAMDVAAWVQRVADAAFA